MNQIKISVEVVGTWCNNWPRFKIIGNNYTYFDNSVEGNKVIEFTMPLQDSNNLILQHYGKQFGENNIWDTRSENNCIVEDRAVQLVRLEFDKVDIAPYLIKHWPFKTDDAQHIATDYFGFNGCCSIDFTSPVYDWIITNLVYDPKSHLVKAQDLIVETSHSNLFNYDEDLIILKEIEKLLKKHAHLFNKSS